MNWINEWSKLIMTNKWENHVNIEGKHVRENKYQRREKYSQNIPENSRHCNPTKTMKQITKN